jgi:hypothetical protein
VADRQLLGRDDSFGLVADVQEDLVVIDPDDLPRDDVAVVKIFQRRLDGRRQLVAGQVPLGRPRTGGGGARGLYIFDLPSAPSDHAASRDAAWDRPLGRAIS